MKRSGALFKRDILARFEEPDPAQLVLIDQASRLLERLDRAEKQIAADGDTITGGNGQLTSHPLLASSRQDALALAKILGLLFPDENPGARAARERWRKAAGKP